MTKTTYTIHRARTLRDHPDRLPEAPGLYVIMLRRRSALQAALDRAGLEADVLSSQRKAMIYVGHTSDSLRRRVGCHLSDDTRRSNFRMSLGALLADELILAPGRGSRPTQFWFEPESEQRLSAWIFDNLDIGLLVADGPTEIERQMIEAEQPLFNITGRRRSKSAWTLLMLRRKCQAPGACQPPTS